MQCVSLKPPMFKRQHSAPGSFSTTESSKGPSQTWPSLSTQIRSFTPERQVSPRSPELGNSEHQTKLQTPKNVKEQPFSIVVANASQGRNPSKQSQGSNTSKDRSLERKALNVQLLPSELEQVQHFFSKESPCRPSESLPSDTCSEGKRPTVDFLRDVLASNKFNASIGGLILLNTFFMGLELDQHPLADASAVMITFWQVPKVPQLVFDAVEVTFFVIFGLEMLLRFVVSGRALLFEVTTYIDLAALAPVLLVFLFDVQSSKQLAVLRVFRLLKLTRISRLIRLSRELSVLVRSIASSFRSLMWIGALLLIVVYCSAITCTMLIGHDSSFSPENEQIRLFEETYGKEVSVERYWGSTMRSMVTLFQIFTLDDWNGIARPIIETHSPTMILFFVFFIFLTTFGLLNLLMGTIVDHSVNAHKDAELEKEKLLQDEHNQMLLITLRLFSIMDLNGNGKLSSSELLQFFKEHNLEDILQEDLDRFKVKIDYQELLDMCLSIADAWRTDEEDDDNGITIEEFAGAAMRLRGNARSRDLLSVHVLTKSTMSRVASCEKKLAQHGEIMSSISGKLDHILEVLSDSKEQSLTCLECLDKGSRHREIQGASSRSRGSSPKRKLKSPSRTHKSPSSKAVKKLRPLSACIDESTCVEGAEAKEPGSGHREDRILAWGSSDLVVSPTGSGIERLQQVHEQRMAAGMELGMFGHKKASSFVEQLMTTTPEFANTESGAAIRSYTLKRSMTRPLTKEDHLVTSAGSAEARRRRSESLPASAATETSNVAAIAAMGAAASLQLRRQSTHSTWSSYEKRVMSDTNLPPMSPGWLWRKLGRSSNTEARRRQSASADAASQSPCPGWCSDDSAGSS